VPNIALGPPGGSGGDQWWPSLYPDGIVFDLTNVNVPSGTQTLVLNLTAQWQYPRGGAYVGLTSTQSVHTINVVAANDLPLVSFGDPGGDEPGALLAADSPAGTQVRASLVREIANGNADGLELQSVVTLAIGETINEISGEPGAARIAVQPITLRPGELVREFSFVVTTAPVPGDRINVSIGSDSDATLRDAAASDTDFTTFTLRWT
jgi:hypothetical protein